MTAPVLAGSRGRPTLVGLQRTVERVRLVAAGRTEQLIAERGELAADVEALAPAADVFRRISLDYSPEAQQLAMRMQHRLARMRARAGSNVL